MTMERHVSPTPDAAPRAGPARSLSVAIAGIHLPLVFAPKGISQGKLAL